MTASAPEGPANQPVSFGVAAARPAWPVPVEIVLALPMSDKVRSEVRARTLYTQATRGATAELFVRRKRLFAQVFYGQAKNESVLFPLDVWEV